MVCGGIVWCVRCNLRCVEVWYGVWRCNTVCGGVVWCLEVWYPIENNSGADWGKMVGSGGVERRITGGPPWGRRRNVRFISIAAHRRLRPSNLLWLHCGPRRSSHHKSPVTILSGSFSGHIGEF